VKNSVRDLRAQLNWTQADRAQKLGVSRQTVNAIETEKYHPSLPLACKIAKILRKPVEEIFKGLKYLYTSIYNGIVAALWQLASRA
jgi:putative transcriptional regulator